MEVSLEAVLAAMVANPALGLIIVLCLGATIVNGATDAPNAIASVVGTRAMRPTPAVLMAACQSGQAVSLRQSQTIDVTRDAANVVLRISDSGQGIPDEFKDRVFERFFRVDASRGRATGGTGLGLAIVKHVAETCGGEVHVEDSESQGATFVVTLPACGAAQ